MYAVLPWQKPVVGSLRLPGSKSITARALILAALNPGTMKLEGVLEAEDSQAMITGLQALGFDIECLESAEGLACTVQGQGGRIPLAQATISVQAAGTAGRFLPALAALHPHGQYLFTCDPAFERRPMTDLLQVLETLGARIHYQKTPGHYPFILESQGLKGEPVTISGSKSSQFLSALLMVAPCIQGELTLTRDDVLVSAPFIKMTQKMMTAFGSSISLNDNKFLIKPNGYQPQSQSYRIEPDATAASYFEALVALHSGQLNLQGLGNCELQGDFCFINYLKNYGLQGQIKGNDYHILSKGIQGKGPNTLNFQTISDTFITLAALAPLLGAPLTLTGLSHTRLQETDRLVAVAEALTNLGQCVSLTEDSITITPKPLKPATIKTYGDHRMAMAFAILGTYDLNKNANPWLFLENPSVCSKTYPRFFNDLNRLRTQSHE